MTRQMADLVPNRCEECNTRGVEVTRQGWRWVCADCRQVMDDNTDRYAVDTAMAVFARSRTW